MASTTYPAAVIGRTGRGDYGHGLDVALRDQPRIRLVAVADEDPAGRAAAARRLGVERAYADYREMLDRERPRIVAVAPRWPDAHAEMILACAERGIHVFCEKPLAPDLAACDAIVDACARAHVKLAMAFQTRYSARYDRVKEMLAGGAIGELLEIRGRGKEDRRGGGEDLMVLGCHLMDLVRGLVGPATWCFARITQDGRPISPRDAREGTEPIGPIAGDRIDAQFGLEGTPALYHFATARPREGAGRRFGLTLLGSKGAIALGTGWRPPAYWLDDPSWTGATGARRVEITSDGPGRPETQASDSLVDGNRAIVRDLIAAIESDGQPRAGVEDGRAAIEMIVACYAAHLRGAPVTLPLAERAEHPLRARATQDSPP